MIIRLSNAIGYHQYLITQFRLGAAEHPLLQTKEKEKRESKICEIKGMVGGEQELTFSSYGSSLVQYLSLLFQDILR